MMAPKRILFLLRHGPYASSHAVEALETVLVAGVFDQQVSVLFRDDGVWQLLAGQDGSIVEQRTVSRVLAALPEYDVTRLYACRESLQQRGLTAEDLVLPVELIDPAEQHALIGSQDAVVND